MNGDNEMVLVSLMPIGVLCDNEIKDLVKVLGGVDNLKKRSINPNQLDYFIKHHYENNPEFNPFRGPGGENQVSLIFVTMPNDDKLRAIAIVFIKEDPELRVMEIPIVEGQIIVTYTRIFLNYASN